MKKTAKDRMNKVTVMLERYPHTEDWHRVRFSDEVYFGYGTQDRQAQDYSESTVARMGYSTQKSFESLPKKTKTRYFRV